MCHRATVAHNLLVRPPLPVADLLGNRLRADWSAAVGVRITPRRGSGDLTKLLELLHREFRKRYQMGLLVLAVLRRD